jgi:hypothetical protein
LMSNPSGWISRAPVAALRRVRLRFRTDWAGLSGLFRLAASMPATPSPRSRMSFMITFASPAPDSCGRRHRRPPAHTGHGASGETVGGSSCSGELSSSRARPRDFRYQPNHAGFTRPLRRGSSSGEAGAVLGFHALAVALVDVVDREDPVVADEQNVRSHGFHRYSL